MPAATTRTVPYFSYPHVFSSQQQAFLDIFHDVGRRGAFILQYDLEDFEKHLAAFLGAPFAAGVANATDGLLIALRAAGLRSGDEVILSSHTMIATAAAVHFAGGVPVPVECGADHLIDPAAAEAAVTSRTRVLLPTHLNGRTCDMAALESIAVKYSLLIIEDAAQALGSRFRGRCAGSFGCASAISFYPAKVLGCFGDGGAVIVDSLVLHERVRQLRDHGRNHDGEIVSWGLNSRLDNLQAAFLDFQLDSYHLVMERRRRIASLYDEHLRSVSALVLPPPPGSEPDRFDIFQNYEIEADRRDQLKAFLTASGVGTLLPWGGTPVHSLRRLGFTQHLPVTDRLFSRVLMLPINMALSDDDVSYVCDQVRAFYGYSH